MNYLIFTNLSLVVVLLIVIHGQAKLVQLISRLKTKILATEHQQLVQAQQEAQKIVDLAFKKARVIEKQAQINRQAWQKQLDQKLAAVMKNNIKVFKKESNEIEKQLLAGLQTAVEAYKKTQLKKMDEKIASLVNQMSQKVLGRSLSLPEHETLIFEALEKAKKESLLQ